MFGLFCEGILKFCESMGRQNQAGISHGGLYRWRENSLPIFLFQKLKENLTRYSRTMLTASKNLLINVNAIFTLQLRPHVGHFDQHEA